MWNAIKYVGGYDLSLIGSHGAIYLLVGQSVGWLVGQLVVIN
jgi:hypothetical protein